MLERSAFFLLLLFSLVQIFVFQDRVSLSPWLSWNLLCRPGWPQTQKCIGMLRLKL